MRRLPSVGIALLLCAGALYGQSVPAMKFNEVREVAPGVFFRFSSISATDKTVPFGGSNNIWVVFRDYVLVYDANFPKEAGDVVAAIRKTTDKPIRYVLDSHHHGDHAYGNAVFQKAGATVIASAPTAKLLRENGPAEFKKEGEGPTGRKDVAGSTLKVPELIFEKELVFDDDTQRVELHFLGHAHTAGDAFLYLPKHKILCTGDACTNGPFNYMGHGDSASWIEVLGRAKKFDVKLVCPGHGPLAGPDVLDLQKRWFVELRASVKLGIDKGKEPEEIAKSLDMPWHKQWTGIDASERLDNVKHVYDELTGRALQWDIVRDLGLKEVSGPTKATPGWAVPKRIVVPALMPAKLRELKTLAPDVLFVPVKTTEEAAKEAVDADAVLGFASADLVQTGPRLRWVQGETKGLSPRAGLVLTGTPRFPGDSAEARDRTWRLFRENVRRFVAGEPLLDRPR